MNILLGIHNNGVYILDGELSEENYTFHGKQTIQKKKSFLFENMIANKFISDIWVAEYDTNLFFLSREYYIYKHGNCD